MAQPIWNSSAGSIGTYPSFTEIVPIQLSASAVLPAVSLTYAIISGNLPTGLIMTVSGLIYGTPNNVSANTTYAFVVRATDNLQNIRDRTFTLTVTGAQSPSLVTPTGLLFSQSDSIWVEFPIVYSNPISSNPVVFRITQGQLPIGLEMNEYGLIRGYPAPPISNVNLPLVNTAIVAISSNVITCASTTGFTVGRPIIFLGTSFGGIIAGATYYVKEIFVGGTSFTVSNTSGGSISTFTDAAGYMTAALPSVSQGQPAVQTYSFTVELDSPLGTDSRTYSITIANQQAPASIGGDNKPINTRVPTILNTRPATYNIGLYDIDYSYYVLPPNGKGVTYAPNQNAYIGKFNSDNQFTFKILGKDFDSNPLEYVFVNLPLGLTGDTMTGWISGNPTISDNSISQFSFSVAVRKASNPALQTPFVKFDFIIKNDIEGVVTWLTPANLGTISNGLVSTLKVQAESDVSLKYRLQGGGTLPPNLVLLDDGEISGVVAYQPTSAFLSPNSTADFTFTVEAYSDIFPIVNSTRTFTVTVDMQFGQPTDTLYIKCTPSIADRNLLADLLSDTTIIPTDYLYRAGDPYFGKASNVTYEHAYGIYASEFDAYVAAVTKNHYWRQLTLGDIKTAVARNNNGEIIYEVVYSEVIDNLINPEGQSVSKEVIWPRFIPLDLPSPGFAKQLYPNSLPNMRKQVGDILGQEYDSNLLPKWMTSQQLDGSTTGFVPAWVICYTKPGFAEIVKNNINTLWVDVIGNPYRLNVINFKIDRFTVDKSTTFDYDNALSPAAWTGLPSASPTPDPLDSKNFYVLFPRQTILPDTAQY
jgi:hypothetical protein